jgi:hypothetical protein
MLALIIQIISGAVGGNLAGVVDEGQESRPAR